MSFSPGQQLLLTSTALVAGISAIMGVTAFLLARGEPDVVTLKILAGVAILALLVVGSGIGLISHYLTRPVTNHYKQQLLQQGFTWEHVSGIVLRVNAQQLILDANPNFQQLFDLCPGSYLSSIQRRNERELIQQKIDQSLSTRSMVDFEASLLDRYGEWGRWAMQVRLWQQNDGDQVWLLVTGDDITQRYFMEAQLREEQQRLSTYINTMQTLLIICDENGHVTRVNLQAQQLLQIPEDQINGYPFSYLIPQQATSTVEREWQNLLSRHNGNLSLEFPVLSSTGKEHIISWRMTRLTSANTSQGQVLLAGLDITESVANRQALETANSRIREALTQAEQANHSKSIFLANMSHEIRTPMNGILGATELILDSNLTTEQRHYLDIVHTSSQSLLEILNDILDLSKIESGNLELEQIDFDLNQQLSDLKRLFDEPVKRKGLTFIYYYDGDIPQYWNGDPKRIRQIITNLISNAIKFTDYGQIEVQVTGKQTEGALYDIRIAVTDTGIGISQSKKEQVFSAFRQADSSTSRRYGGTGLGLTICRHLASAMNGDVELESSPGVGSTFSLQLPLQAAKPPAVTKRPSLQQSPALSGRILLAEDNEVNQRVASRMLEKLGLECVVVSDGRQALQALKQDAFDLILMDINMPVLDGIQATRHIRQLSGDESQIPILALTANAMMEDRQRCLSAGMNGFVSKPIRMATLRAALVELLPEQLAPASTQAGSTSPS
ncbi:ATP-binding protein [Oceanobacter sp. 5_MG-2023]|uniref:PAS domain-containing hybrid sensor histidine kinase/response regulator n=1 Tax=Oceanobacter sp. 5_MG-2023 TaxID=3062645 RepID=UPI0026E1AA9F|nr:ATP-binding protein [Oceanobacter sp. 5_MG-2023]MDO6680736.1 ATP-binding protein [Oceanobacter sp. 5_MG-2023]